MEQSAELPDENGGCKAMGSQHTAEYKTARKRVEKSCCHKLVQSGHCPTAGSAQGFCCCFLFRFFFFLSLVSIAQITMSRYFTYNLRAYDLFYIKNL